MAPVELTEAVTPATLAADTAATKAAVVVPASVAVTAVVNVLELAVDV